jgi:hypothetical protein
MKIEFNRKRNTRLHSREHVLAEDLSRLMHEEKRFSSYLGIAKRYHEDDLRALAKRVAAKEGLLVSNRGRYFFAAVKGLQPKYIFKTRNDTVHGKKTSHA